MIYYSENLYIFLRFLKVCVCESVSEGGTQKKRERNNERNRFGAFGGKKQRLWWNLFQLSLCFSHAVDEVMIERTMCLDMGVGGRKTAAFSWVFWGATLKQ